MSGRLAKARAEVKDKVQSARQAIARGDVEESRSRLAELRTIWVDCPDAKPTRVRPGEARRATAHGA